jgi:hypothetical protein
LDGIQSILDMEAAAARDQDPTAFEMYRDALKTVQELYDHVNKLRSHVAKKYVLDE